MRSNTTTSGTRRLGTAAAGLVSVLVTVAGCASDEPSGSDPAGVDELPSATESISATASDTPAGVIASFADSFDDDANGWGLPPGGAGTIQVQDGDFVWDLKKPQLAPHVIANTLGVAFDEDRLDMTDVRVTTSVTPLRGVAAAGVFCREVPDTDADFQWYEFVVRDGYAAIRQADLAQRLDVLAETEDVSLPTGEPATLEATCVDGDNGDAQLTFELNGEQLLQAEVSDPLGNGVPGLQVYDSPASESDEPMMVAWHDFAIEPAD